MLNYASYSRQASPSELRAELRRLEAWYRELVASTAPPIVWPPACLEEALETRGLVPPWVHFTLEAQRRMLAGVEAAAWRLKGADEAACLVAIQERLLLIGRLAATICSEDILDDLADEGIHLSPDALGEAMAELEGLRLALRVPGTRSWVCLRVGRW